MIFANDHLFYLVAAVPLLMIAFYFGYRFKKYRLSKLIDPRLWPAVTDSVSYIRRFWKRAMFLVGLSFVLIAVLRPQFGLLDQKVTQKGHDIFIALDLSQSMETNDVGSSRFARAKQEARVLLQELQGNRVGLIGFAGAAFVHSPLTLDTSALNLFLDDLVLGSISNPGTNVAKAISLARQTLLNQTKGESILILITDGESFKGDALSAAKEAAKDDMTIITMGIGTPNGEPIPLIGPNNQFLGYKKDKNNKVILSKLNDQELAAIASITGGNYYHSGPSGLVSGQLYHDLSEKDKKELESHLSKQQKDQYQLFLFLGFVILMIEFCLSERKRSIND